MKSLSLRGAILLAITVQTLVTSHPIWAMTCAQLFENGGVENAPSIEALGQRVFAVSALRATPNSERIAANTIDHNAFGNPWKLPVLVRFGVHFSLGELVRPHSGITEWENRKVALIKPLGELDNLVNLNPYDTYTVGGVSLTPGSVLVLPQGTTLPFKCSCKVHFYDPETSSLRVAVDQAIEKKGGWSLRMKEDVNDQIDSVFQLNGREHLTSTFFSRLLERNPHFSVGTELNSLNGHAFRLPTVTQVLSRLMKSFSSMSNDFGSKYFQFQIKVIEHHVNQIYSSKLIEKMPDESRLEFENALQEVEGLLNIARLDQHLRTKLSKTLVNTNLTPDLWANRRSLDTITKLAERESFVQQLMGSDQEPPAPPQYYALLLSTLPTKAERTSFVNENKDVIPEAQLNAINEFVLQILDQ